MLQGVAALKLKGNLYFLISLQTQSNKHIFWYFGYELNLFPIKMKDWPVQHFVSCTTSVSCATFNLKEYISVNIAITVIFNLNINHVYVYNRFSKTCYCKYLDV